MKKLLRLAAGATVSLSLLGVGVASAQTGTIGTTGQGSNNQVNGTTNSVVAATNNNNVGGTNINPQDSHTGAVTANGNTTVGGAQSGQASNSSSTNASLTVANTSSVATTAGVGDPSASDSGSINLTGQGSTNLINSVHNSTVAATNNNTLNFVNTNIQTSTSGAVTENGNTTAGSAMSGDASNTSTNTIDFSVTN